MSNLFLSYQVKDPKSHHDFVSTGVVNGENEVIVYYAGNFKNVSKQYGTAATLKFNSDSQAKEYISKQDALMTTSTEPEPIVFRSKNSTLHDVFFGESEYGDQEEVFDLYIGLPSHGSKPFMTANMKVVDVPQYEHFDDDEYPEFSSYFMYGDKKHAFLFHIPTKNPDFLQVIIPNQFFKQNVRALKWLGECKINLAALTSIAIAQKTP